ncbi:sodium:proton antiporter [Aquabacterium olei]|uniref:Sodium:proton antiporter n=1 Tax=Aquabacterium olei TaxID=1296669 RepID=A0A2U8FY37_9BURK|nr:cation:proton antiporter [Aquabacterium olei]AWI55344.1 sodium:proton antiporter [Aquabacterium olei]
MFMQWCLVIGVLLVVIGLTDTLRRRLPVGTSAIYLLCGYLLGPHGLGFIRLDLMRDAALLEVLTEIAVLVSLFAVGLRLRVPLRDGLWRAPVLMATLAMLVTIALLTGLGMWLGLSLGGAVLMAAVLAPTDPVLASDVQVAHPQDHDGLRFSLTGEGGLNDGAAFPVVMLALGLMRLHDLGSWGLHWVAVDLVWATAGGLTLGWLTGLLFSRIVVYLRREQSQAFGMESFFTLGLIALTYGLALLLHTYGFLAVFAAGLAMRQFERTDSDSHRHERTEVDLASTPDDGVENLGPSAQASPAMASAYMAKEVLDFTLDLERIAELAVMLIIGSLLSLATFDAFSLPVALGLIFVVRPVAIYLITLRSVFTSAQRRFAAWFGVRGVGSMYYLMFAVTHGANTRELPAVADAVLATIALSVLLHGSSATPAMRAYQQALARRR